MGFFDVEDGEGGSAEDRIAIIAVVGFAFCWIPIFLVWKCISVLRHPNTKEKESMPTTTHDADPEKHPYHPEAPPKKPTASTAEGDRRQPSVDAGRRSSKDVERRSSKDVERRSSRASHRHHQDAGDPTETASNRHGLDSAPAAHAKHTDREHHSASDRHRARQGPASSKRVRDVADTPAPSRHRHGQRHGQRVNDQQQGFQNVRLE